jgi:histone H3
MRTIAAEPALKRHRWRPGSVALRQIRTLRKSTELTLRRMPFKRLVLELLAGIDPRRMQSDALHAVQEAAEAYLVGLFEDMALIGLHARRVTAMSKDLRLALRLRGDAAALGDLSDPPAANHSA